MGFFQNLLGIEPDNSVNKVDAAVAPYNYQQYAQPFDYFGLSSVTRAQTLCRFPQWHAQEELFVTQSVHYL
jgi:hypothetical protein